MEKRAHNFRDRTGERIGRLTVLRLADESKSDAIRWLCRCDCGNQSVVAPANLQNGNTTSCGCLRSEVARARATVHGKHNTATYRAWRAMIQRCYDPCSDAYKYYGAKGVSVCERWLCSFSAFALDMGDRPEGMSIDRIDGNGNYEPSNCRWTSHVQQSRNRSSNRVLTFNGKTQTAVEWAEELGANPFTIYSRLKRGWSHERALSTPFPNKQEEYA